MIKVEIVQIEPFAIFSRKKNEEYEGVCRICWQGYGTTHGNPPRETGKIYRIMQFGSKYNERLERFVGDAKFIERDKKGNFKFVKL